MTAFSSTEIISLLNYYFLSWDFAYNPWLISNSRTRGGPLTLSPPGWQADISLSSDDKKNVVYGLGVHSYQSDFEAAIEYDVSCEYRPTPNLTISVAPFISRDFQRSMYVETFADALCS